MKYLSINSVLNAYRGCRGKTQNKFWGLLAILQALNVKIEPAKSYTFQTSDVSQSLDELFSFKEDSRDRRRGDVWSVIFSNSWFKVIPEIMFSDTPNITDVAVWFFRKSHFPDDISVSTIVANFLDTFHFSKEDAEFLFDTTIKEVSFSDSLYSDLDLLNQVFAGESVPDISKLSLSFEGTKYLKSNAGNLGQASFVQTLYSAQAPQKCLILTQFDYNKEYGMRNQDKSIIDDNFPRQQIFYGAPGTGKSREIKEKIKDRSVIRTTFHPDSDYSTFVGAYKPSMNNCEVRVVPVVIKDGINLDQNNGTYREKRIVYKFVMQAFMKAYLGAWKKYVDAEGDVKPQFLIIEEINRGNCAQIFGDLFQLLDRGEKHFSEYPIEADTDLQEAINMAFNENGEYKLDKDIDVDGAVEYYSSIHKDGTLSSDIQQGRVLLLPPNLYIWATMNTSDQSLFPIDSAFKRRWDWKYMPISDGKKGWQIEANGKRYDWWDFLEKMNAKIGSTTNSEDKKLGYFFCKAKDGVIDAETFVGKVVFYIWNDVFKDFAEEAGDLFKDSDDTLLSFNKFYYVGMDGKAKVAEGKVERLLQNLGVDEVGEVVTNDEVDEVIDDTESGNTRTLQVEFEDETIAIKRFPQYLQVLRKIGLEKVEAVASEKQVVILGCALVSKGREEAIEESTEFSYVESDGFNVVKGIKGKLMLRFLPIVSERYNLNLKAYYK